MITLWLSIIDIIIHQNLNIEIIKVPAHSGIERNEIIDKEVSQAHNDNYKFLTTTNDSFDQINYYPLWNNIPINTNLRKFLTNLSKKIGLEKFLNLNRNKKYLQLEIDWESTFYLLNTDIENTKITFMASKIKWKKV